jgi:enoyl-CoA hydratase
MVAVLTGANGRFCAQAALRSDRLCSYEQWRLPLEEALAVEYRHGIATLRTGEIHRGLECYASGQWR